MIGERRFGDFTLSEVDSTFQTDRLVMIALGILNDAPPYDWPSNLDIPPKLEDGIHLRWSFKRNVGFPLYGYYLFRRKHIKGRSLCISRFNLELIEGSLPTRKLRTPDGYFSSDQKITLVDIFPPSGVFS